MMSVKYTLTEDQILDVVEDAKSGMKWQYIFAKVSSLHKEQAPVTTDQLADWLRGYDSDRSATPENSAGKLAKFVAGLATVQAPVVPSVEMNGSRLHGEIMNIQTTSKGIGTAVETVQGIDNDWETRLAMAYKLGHRDARHAAAELAALAHGYREQSEGVDRKWLMECLDTAIEQVGSMVTLTGVGDRDPLWKSVSMAQHDQAAKALGTLCAITSTLRATPPPSNSAVREAVEELEALRMFIIDCMDGRHTVMSAAVAYVDRAIADLGEGGGR